MRLDKPDVAHRKKLLDGFLNIFLSNPDLMVARSQINLCEVTCIMKLIYQLINAWNGVPVLDCPFVLHPVINAHPQCTILLLHHHNQRSKRRLARPDVTHRKKFLDGFLNLILEPLRMLVWYNHHGFSTLLQLNDVLNTSVWWSTRWDVTEDYHTSLSTFVCQDDTLSYDVPPM